MLTDVRFAIRTLAKSPMFTAVAVFSLALGIGANSAIFTLLDQVLLRLLPVKDPQQLVQLAWRGSHYGSNTGYNALSYPLYKDFRDKNQVFSGVLCRYTVSLNMGYSGQTERVDGELVSGNYFETLGVGAAVGRTITPEDDRTPGGHPVAVLSYDFWRNRFNRDPSVIGQKISVNGHDLTIIGVSQKSFDGVEVGWSPKIRIPVMMKAQMTPGFWAELYSLENRRARWVNVFARLRPGVSLAQAKASLQPLFHSVLEMEVRDKEFARASPYTKQQFLKAWIDVEPAARGRSSLRREAATPLWVLTALVGFVLLIACANVANLMITRAANRQKEMAVRLALGASRLRVIRQLIVESVFIAIAGGAAGLVISTWTDHVLIRLVPAGEGVVPLSSDPDLRILTFTFAVSVLTGILFGLAPALQASKVDVAPTLKENAGCVLGGHVRIHRALVASQVFLSVLLLIGAGLFIRSLRNLRTLNPGFRTEKIVAFSVDPTLSGYSKERGLLFYRQLLEKVAAIPGIESAGLGLVRVLDGDEWDSSVVVEGYEPKPGENMNPYFNAASTGYFNTLGIPILAGRDFRETDGTARDAKGEPTNQVGIVNEKFARRFFRSAGAAVGRHFGFGGNPGDKADIEIVGVVRDVKYMNMRDEIPQQVFVPYPQMGNAFQMTAYARTFVDPDQVTASLRRAVRELDPKLPIFAVRTLDAQLDRVLSAERLVAFLASAFGVLATVLAAIGLYGVMAYNVVRRTREIGIRMALGARQKDVTRLVMKEVFLLLAVGVALALPAAWALTRFVKSQLYGITPNDPLTIALAVVGIAITAIVAGYVPAMRAARIDPNRALRYE